MSNLRERPRRRAGRFVQRDDFWADCLTGRDAASASKPCVTPILVDQVNQHDRDLPFVLIYLIDQDGSHARLAGASGVAAGQAISPEIVTLNEATSASAWPFAQVAHAETAQVVEGLQSRFDSVPPGPWSDPPHTALVLPILSNRQ